MPELLEFQNLIMSVRDSSDGPELPLCHVLTAWGGWQGKNTLPDLRRKAQQSQDLSYPDT